MRSSVALTLPLFPPSTPAVVVQRESLSPALPVTELAMQAKAYADVETRAPATRQAYRTDFRTFEAWCGLHGLVALPASPMTVGVYLAALAGEGKRASTLERAL